MENQELSRRALNLSLAVYRVTAKFPQGEVLAGQMRELGNQIAGDLAQGNFADIEKKINRLRIYFQVAKAQNWVKPINWLILDFEYYKLQREVLFELAEGDNRGLTRMENTADKRGEQDENNIMSHNIKIPKKSVGQKLFVLAQARSNSRQSKILTLLDKNGSLKMSDLIPLFKEDSSERTLRNELNDMIKADLIKKSGVNKFTEYSKV